VAASPVAYNFRDHKGNGCELCQLLQYNIFLIALLVSCFKATLTPQLLILFKKSSSDRVVASVTDVTFCVPSVGVRLHVFSKYAFLAPGAKNGLSS
jgi:hypothetical protein